MKIVKLTVISSIVSLNLMAVDLNSVMSNVAQTNPKVIEKKKEFNSVYETLQVSEGDFFLPSVDLSAGIGRYKTKYKKPSSDTTNSTNKYLSISATENLFNGYGTVNDIDAKKAALASSAFSYIQTLNEVSLNAAKVYLDLARNKELLNVEVDNFNKHKKILSAMQARSRGGVGVIGDLQEITAKTNLSYTNYLTANKNLKASQISMNKYMGTPIDTNTITAPGVGESLTYTLPEAIKFALTHNPSIFVQKYNVIQARYNMERDKKEFLPKVDFTISHKYNDGINNDTGSESQYTQLSGGFGLTWNLYRGMKDVHTKQKNISLIQAEQEKYNSIKRDLVEEIELAWMSYKMQQREYEYLTKYVQSAREKLVTNTKLFQIGKKSLFEFLSSQTDFNSAKEKLINTKYDLVFTKLRVLKALGVLTDMVNPDAKRSVGILSNGLHDYRVMSYVADRLPTREESINTSGSTNIDDVMSFASYQVVAPASQTIQEVSIDTQVLPENDEVHRNTYDEEYIAPKVSIKSKR